MEDFTLPYYFRKGSTFTRSIGNTFSFSNTVEPANSRALLTSGFTSIGGRELT